MLNVYAHVTGDMQRQAADKIDRGIGKVGTPTESLQTNAGRAIMDFKAQGGKHRYWGSGYLGQRKGGRWAGRYTIKWPNVRKETRSVYASTEGECEKLLAVLITEIKVESATEKKWLRAENKAS